MALLLVIWVLALLSLLAAGLTVAARSDAALVRNREQSAQAQALAEAGVSLAILGLLETDPAAQWPADGEKRHFAITGGRVDVVVQDEGGKIDINQADEFVLGGLLAEFVDARTAADVAAAVVAARNRRRSEVTTSAAPRAVLFATVDEVKEVPGFDSLLFERVAPFLTAYSGQARVNPRTAPREVLLAAPGVVAGEVDRMLTMRRSGAGAPALAGADNYLGRVQVVSIRAAAETDGRSVFVREAVVILLRNPAEPYRVITWRRGD